MHVVLPQYIGVTSIIIIVVVVSSRIGICRGAVTWNGDSGYGAESHTFSYDIHDTLLGPDNWKLIDTSPVENACDGTHNSPIDIPNQPCARYEDYQLTHGTCYPEQLVYELTPTGLRAQYPYDFTLCESPRIKIPGKPQTFRGLQFHIHVGTEHAIGGHKVGVAELHIDHKNPYDDRFAMLAIMIQADAVEDHPLFAILLNHWAQLFHHHEEMCSSGTSPGGANTTTTATTTPSVAAAVTASTVHSDAGHISTNDDHGDGGGTRGRRRRRKLQTMDHSAHHGSSTGEVGHDNDCIYNLLDENSGFYLYEGGYTVPPCTEIVWWSVMDQTISISPRQYMEIVDMTINYRDMETCELGTFASNSGITSRPLMPLNDRIVERVCPTNHRGNNDDDENLFSAAYHDARCNWNLGVVLSLLMTMTTMWW